MVDGFFHPFPSVFTHIHHTAYECTHTDANVHTSDVANPEILKGRADFFFPLFFLEKRFPRFISPKQKPALEV